MRGTIARARRFTFADWRLLIGASLAQIATACALRMMTVPAVRMSFARMRPIAAWLLRGSRARVIWAIEATGRRLGRRSSCLVRAIVVQSCLGSPDSPLQIEVAVRRDDAGALESHAWVRDGQRVIIGGPVDTDFVSLVVWESAA